MSRKVSLTVIKTFHIEFPDDATDDDVSDRMGDVANSIVIEDDDGLTITESELVSDEWQYLP